MDATDASATIPIEEARQKLKVSHDVFQALLISGLLGFWSATDGVSLAGIEHFIRYGTQWRDDLPPRNLDADALATLPVAGAIQPPSTRSEGQIVPKGVPFESTERDVSWIAQFYFRANPFFFPVPSELGLLGRVPIRLTGPKRIEGARLPTYLFPDPDGFLAMATVWGNVPPPPADALTEALGIISPILDELAVKTDAPLPVCQVVVVGVPSGVINIPFADQVPTKNLAETDLRPGAFEEVRDSTALYREGISSNNPFHQFMTLWKAYENACYVRATVRAALKRRDVKFQAETFPDVFAFKGYVGMNFEQAKQRLEAVTRVPLAHGAPRGARPKTSASPEDYTAVATRVPIIRFMAYVTIHNVRATLTSERRRLIQELCALLRRAPAP